MTDELFDTTDTDWTSLFPYQLWARRVDMPDYMIGQYRTLAAAEWAMGYFKDRNGTWIRGSIQINPMEIVYVGDEL